MSIAKVTFLIFRGICIALFGLLYLLDGSAHYGKVYALILLSLLTGIVSWSMMALEKQDSNKYFTWFKISILIVDILFFTLMLNCYPIEWIAYIAVSILVFLPAIILIVGNLKFILKAKEVWVIKDEALNKE